MIPVHRPSPVFLRQTLDSVLAQDIPPGRLQLEIVDDCSPSCDVGGLVHRIAGEGVTVTRLPHNLGLAGCWNACIDRARGQWVHLLHQDDVIFPGFYNEMRALVQRFPSAGAAFSRYVFIDEHSAWKALSPIESHEQCLLDDWQFKLTCGQRIQCPSIIVRRSVYEDLGGFRSDLPYCLDWEMWTRISANYSVAHSPAILTGYRLHAASESSRLSADTTAILDQKRTFDELLNRLPPARRKDARSVFGWSIAPSLLRHSVECYVRGNYDSALELIGSTRELPLPPSTRTELRRIARNSIIKRWLSR